MSEEYGHPCRLYVISPPQIELAHFETQLKAALKGGDIGAFQLRLKDTPKEEIRTAAKALLPLCHAHEVAFIVNDDPQLAFDVGADGVHLGQEDMSVKDARNIVGPDGVIGVSCHDSSHLAMEAGETGADYVAFGAFYDTTSKSPEKLAKYGTPSPEILEWWMTYTVIPCVAIGGITPQNCGPLVEAGADFIAAINGIWNHKDGPKQAVKDYNHAIRKHLKHRSSADKAA